MLRSTHIPALAHALDATYWLKVSSRGVEQWPERRLILKFKFLNMSFRQSVMGETLMMHR